MKLRLSILLAVLAGCGGGDNPGPDPADPGGAGSGGAIAASGGSGGASGSGGFGSGGASTGGTGGTAGAAGNASTVPATFDTLKRVITDAPCFGAGCHNDEQNPLSLKVDDQLYMRLTSHMSKNCGNLPIVNPGKPQESALVKILKGPCGTTPRMPLGCVDDQDSTCVPTDYIAAIEQWIADGAMQP